MPTAELEAKAKLAGFSFAAVKRAKQELKAEKAVNGHCSPSLVERFHEERFAVLPQGRRFGLFAPQDLPRQTSEKWSSIEFFLEYQWFPYLTTLGGWRALVIGPMRCCPPCWTALMPRPTSWVCLCLVMGGVLPSLAGITPCST